MEEFRRIKRELVAKGAIIDYYQDTMQIPNGNIAKWDLIDHKGAAAVVAVREDGKLLMVRQYRNALERETLEIPAGGLNGREEPTDQAAMRELQEETGITLEESDSIRLVNPLVFSTPGMTDESNALVQIILNREEMPKVSQEGAVGTECFDGFLLLTKEEAQKILKDGVDDQGFFYPLYTWAALMCFATGMWK
mgnify:CR=1 FL=1